MTTTTAPPSLEAKLVVLGAQNVGKTSLVHRYVKQSFIPPAKAASTVGASFLTARAHDAESNTTLRLQIWDTAGQERFRSISRLYYRGANAAILCYDVTSAKSFEEMGGWLRELRANAGYPGVGGEEDEGFGDMVIHVVGTKSDVVAAEPKRREVPFERCIDYVAEQLYPGGAPGFGPVGGLHGQLPQQQLAGNVHSPQSNRSSGFWGQEAIWDCCHEISAKDGEGIDEVFRVITRKLVEQHSKRQERQRAIEESRGRTPGVFGGGGGENGHGYFDLPRGGNGSFRVGHGDKQKSWLSALATPGGLSGFGEEVGVDDEVSKGTRKGRCC